ncbi:MAG: MazG family protein [Verrucomicrobiales bacterium]|nr:MazG family protein [Verrucomicrobiales bacterium]|tara:strand:+ start:2654 stop:3334 length:681 start_codon:yes stop_codon:yes gene_type:complete
MSAKRKKRGPAINDLIEVMERLRAPDGCPWDREQDHKSIRFHAVEEVYELIDAIEMDDDDEMLEECGDLLLQVVFHCQLAKERNAFDFEKAARSITDKLIRRHPHVFGDSDADNVDAVWAQWEKIKREEKKGTQHERPSVLDGIPRHLPALQRAEKLVKKARKNGLSKIPLAKPIKQRYTKASLSKELFALAEYAQNKGWQPEALLRAETKKQEKALRKKESRISK